MERILRFALGVRGRSLPAAAVLIGLSALALLSCGVPYLERARDPQGWSAMAGIDGNAYSVPNFTNEGDLVEHWAVGPFGSVRKTFGESFSAGLYGDYRLNYEMDDATKHTAMTPGAEARLSGKLLLGHSSAIKLDAGGVWAPGHLYPLGELAFLQDLGDAFTLSANVGYPYFLGIGLNFHPSASRHFTPHLAGSLEGLGVGWGLGLEWHQQADSNSALPSKPPAP